MDKDKPNIDTESLLTDHSLHVGAALSGGPSEHMSPKDRENRRTSHIERAGCCSRFFFKWVEFYIEVSILSDVISLFTTFQKRKQNLQGRKINAKNFQHKHCFYYRKLKQAPKCVLMTLVPFQRRLTSKPKLICLRTCTSAISTQVFPYLS